MKVYCLMGLFLSCLLCNCGGTDYTYVDTTEEKQGPGLFSGEDGVFTVVKKGSEEIEQEEPVKKASPE